MRLQLVVYPLAALAVSAAGDLLAQAYPAKPIRLVSGFVAGGSNDHHARVLAPRLGEVLGQSVIVENRAGAGGHIGAEAVARAAPDGYVLLMGAGSMATAPSIYAKLPYDIQKDFAPVTITCQVQNVLVVHPSIPAKTVAALVAIAKAKPGVLDYASSGIGATPHFSAEMFRLLAGIDIVHVPYKGQSEAFNDLLAGRVHFMFTVIQGALPHIESGRLRALAVSATDRSPALPAVPTMQEAGIKGYELSSWFGLMAPAATPRAIVDRINGAAAKTLAMPDIRERVIAGGSDPVTSTPEQFAERIRNDVLKFQKLAKAAGIALQ